MRSLDEKKCSVCLDAFEDPVVTACDHVFCRACILKSLHQAGKTCPICREGVCSAELIAVEEETK